MHTDPRRSIAPTLLALLIFVPQTQAADPVAVCTATKLRRAGEFQLCVLMDAARILRGGESQLARCETKFAASWAKAEAKAAGACRTNGDEAALRAQLAAQAAAVFVALNPAPPTTTTTMPPSGPPCGGSVWPGCGGSCPAGSSCWATITAGPTQACTCLPEVATPCEDSGGNTLSGPTCGGACSAGSVCTTLAIDESPFNATCGCVPIGSTPCINSSSPACGGSCPSGLSCGADILFPCLCG